MRRKGGWSQCLKCQLRKSEKYVGDKKFTSKIKPKWYFSSKKILNTIYLESFTIELSKI